MVLQAMFNLLRIFCCKYCTYGKKLLSISKPKVKSGNNMCGRRYKVTSEVGKPKRNPHIATTSLKSFV